MKQVTFYVSTGYVGSKREETFEYPDDVTEERLEEDFLDWRSNYLDSGWYEE